MPLSVEIVTPEKSTYSREDGTLIAVPSVTGELGFEPGHIPLFAVMTIGEVRVHRKAGVERLAVSGGIVQVSPDRVLVLAETAESSEEIDVLRAREARQRAASRLEQEPEDLDVERARAALTRALNRLKVAGAE